MREFLLFIGNIMQPPQNSQQALAELQGHQSKSQNMNDIISNQRQQLGVTGAEETVKGLRGAINNTTNLLKQVAPSVMGRTGGSLVTNAQATRQIANEQQPISEQLSDQSREYGTAREDLGELQRKAQESATGIYQGQQDRLSYLSNLYNTMYGRENAEREAAERERDRQESIRQFNEQLALQRQSEARQASGGGGGFNLTGASAPAAQAQMSKRNNGGFNFTDAGGQAISAASYANKTGQSIGDVLYSMGQSGDKYAQTLYNQLKADPFFGKGNAQYDAKIKAAYSPIFWGS